MRNFARTLVVVSIGGNLVMLVNNSAGRLGPAKLALGMRAQPVLRKCRVLVDDVLGGTWGLQVGVKALGQGEVTRLLGESMCWGVGRAPGVMMNRLLGCVVALKR